MVNYSVMPQYTYVWIKYRPALLRLMIAASDGPQEYKFADHEFRRLNPREKGGYSFTLDVFQGRSVNNIKNSPVAQDLLVILKQSRTALELTETSTYKFILDKKFVLHVVKVDAVGVDMKAEELLLATEALAEGVETPATISKT
jgi:hypothetical protein